MGVTLIMRRYVAMAVFIVTAFALVFVPGPAMADTVEIHDNSRVLNATDLRGVASTLPDPVRIYTVTQPTDNAALATWLTSKGDPASNVILIVLNTRTKRLVCRVGNRSGLTQSGLDTAFEAFKSESRVSNGNETDSLTAMLDSFKASLRQAGVTAQPSAKPTAWSTTLGSGGKVHVSVSRSRNAFHGLLVWAVGSIFCLVSLTLIALLRRRRSRGGAAPAVGHPVPQGVPGYGPPGAGYGNTPSGPGYGSPAGPGYGPPAGPGYGPPAGPGYGAPAGPGYGPPAGPGFGPPAGPGYGPPAGPAYGPAASPGNGPVGPGQGGPPSGDPGSGNPPAGPPSGEPPYAAW
ncbi:MAG: hypothetical protein JWO67_2319 [Streptosporangiaceae bacterium]|nr:hypothetical protein [Streptosporangiaceae bacterium]